MDRCAVAEAGVDWHMSVYHPRFRPLVHMLARSGVRHGHQQLLGGFRFPLAPAADTHGGARPHTPGTLPLLLPRRRCRLDRQG